MEPIVLTRSILIHAYVLLDTTEHIVKLVRTESLLDLTCLVEFFGLPPFTHFLSMITNKAKLRWNSSII